jgi:DNA-damage-inducible protein J
MPKTAMIRARTDERLKQQVEQILDRLGLTSSEAINLFYHQVQLRKGLPFPVEIPNAETRMTFQKSERGEDVHTHRSAGAMFRKLGI